MRASISGPCAGCATTWLPAIPKPTGASSRWAPAPITRWPSRKAQPSSALGQRSWDPDLTVKEVYGNINSGTVDQHHFAVHHFACNRQSDPVLLHGPLSPNPAHARQPGRADAGADSQGSTVDRD